MTKTVIGDQGLAINGQWSVISRRWFIIFLFLLLAEHCSRITAWAVSDNAGTKNGAFLKIPTDARGVALAETMVSVARGTEGMRWNPAALSTLETQELATTHIQYYQNVSIENVTYGYPMGDSGLAVNGFYLSPGTLEGRDILGKPTGDFKFYDLVGSLGFGGKVLSQMQDGMDLSVGISAKIAQEVIADTQSQNPAFDAGVLVSPKETVHGGLCVRNLSFNKANYPKDITGGLSYSGIQSFLGAVSAEYADDAPIRFGVAGEFRMEEYNSAIRAGYRTHDTLDDSTDSAIDAFRGGSIAGLTMGAGFEYRPPQFATLRLQIDYAIAPFGVLGIAHYLTVTAKW